MKPHASISACCFFDCVGFHATRVRCRWQCIMMTSRRWIMTIQRPLSHHLRMASAKGIACDWYGIGVPPGCRRRGVKRPRIGVLWWVTLAGPGDRLYSNILPYLSNYFLIDPYLSPSLSWWHIYELLGVGSGVECIYSRDNTVYERGAGPRWRPERESTIRAASGGLRGIWCISTTQQSTLMIYG